MSEVKGHAGGGEHDDIGRFRALGEYTSVDGDPGAILHSGEGRSTAGAEGPWPRGFPTVEGLKELNRAIHDDAGTPERYKLDQPAPLESCLARARAAYQPTPEGIIATAAALAHGIAQAQSFRDGNRRTAYFAAQSFLHLNGLGYLSPDDAPDDMLARLLNQLVAAQSSMRPGPGVERFADLLMRRYQRRSAR